MACCAATPARGAEVLVTDADRVYANYVREAATVGAGKIRFEVRGMTLDNDRHPDLTLAGFPVDNVANIRDICIQGSRPPCPTPDNDFELDRVQGGVIDVLGSYVLGKSAEVGFDVPIFIQNSRFIDLPATRALQMDPRNQGHSEVDVARTINATEMGDVLMYGKFKRMVAQHCSVAGGLELTVPTGIEREGFGSGELGFNPFLSTRYQRGRFAVGGHIGYQIYTNDPADVLNWSVEAIVKPHHLFNLRVELAARYFKDFGDRFNDIVVLPGVDIILSENFTVRPTGLANVTDEAIDWGLGVGLALTL
jgi:hypothetical protein